MTMYGMSRVESDIMLDVGDVEIFVGADGEEESEKSFGGPRTDPAFFRCFECTSQGTTTKSVGPIERAPDVLQSVVEKTCFLQGGREFEGGRSDLVHNVVDFPSKAILPQFHSKVHNFLHILFVRYQFTHDTLR